MTDEVNIECAIEGLKQVDDWMVAENIKPEFGSVLLAVRFATAILEDIKNENRNRSQT